MDADVAVSRGLAEWRDGRAGRLAVCAVGGLAAIALSVVVSASGASSHPSLVAVGRALIVGVPIAVGLYSWRAGLNARFGVLLLLIGGACCITTLAESHDSTPYTAGRAAGWLVEVLIVHLVLAFPTGRLESRTDRMIVGAMGLVVLVLFVPRLLLAEHFEVPSPYTSCVRDCPANALFHLGSEPGFVDGVLLPAGALAVCLVTAAAILRLRGRMLDATALRRRMLAPVLAVGVARLALLAFGIAARYVDPELPVLPAVAWLLALAVPAIALAFLAGLLSWQLFVGRALERLAGSLAATSSPRALRVSLGEAWADPTLRIAFPAVEAGDVWLDSRGRELEMPPPGDGRSVTEVRRDGSVIARIIHDEALLSDPGLLDAGVAIAGIELDNQRLGAQYRAATRDARESRARLAASAGQERRRIERDLHDGAQQRLVAVRIELTLAEELVRTDPERAIAKLHVLGRHVEEALEEVRSIAHGIYPPLLADSGLAGALQSVAMRTTVPAAVEARGVRRYPPEIETAVYFSVIEAVQNVLKHAGSVRRIVLSLDGRDPATLRFSVRDDGAGAPDGTVVPGKGITNMQDRLQAIGGDVVVSSTPGVGTLVDGWAPTPVGASAEAVEPS